MKKPVLFLIFGWLGLVSFAQQSVPNGNFENWSSHAYQNPKYYNSSNSETSRVGLAANCEKVSGGFHGSSAIRLTTVMDDGEPYPGYFVNAQPEGDPESWHGGIPVSGTPTGVRGYYRSDIAAGDTGYIILAFSKNGVNIGSYFYQFYGTHTAYTMFTFSLSPALPIAPDSVVVAAISSDVLNENFAAGSMLQLDSISLTGVAAQPAMMNGDFEEWETITSYSLVSWYLQTDDGAEVRSTDAYKGSYAARLETTMGDRDGIPHPNSGQLSTGYYDRNCTNCIQQGGYPFNNQNDTLVFWYKYAASGGSLGQVYVITKAGGLMIGGNMLDLTPENSWRKVELPVQSMSVPDSLIVSFQSSRWDDSLVTNVGAVLVIDEVQLKSQPLHTGLFNIRQSSGPIRVYPNPAKSSVVFTGNAIVGAQYIITNIAGMEIARGTIQYVNQSVDISSLPTGLYYYRIEHKEELQATGKLRVE